MTKEEIREVIEETNPKEEKIIQAKLKELRIRQLWYLDQIEWNK